MSDDAQPYDRFCGLTRLQELQAKGIAAHGGRVGVRDALGPGATLGAAWTAEEYGAPPEAVPGLMFAVYLLFYIATKQVFVDGNKRIAWLAMCEALACMGLEVDATIDEAEALVMAISNNQFKDVEPVYLWVVEHLRELRVGA
ncbi:type II toxin-antitoxin system death-on-curing family toxin [Corallococcus interemptor]|uniref:type II toxin-antitoxin system death-on-curing family toxin n=1 Tax=Corallococcus interemptor TaxID=2316720 RepID=UPI003CFFDDC9